MTGAPRHVRLGASWEDAYARCHQLAPEAFERDRVIHHVELSLFPNWVGSDQQRWVELAGDRLTLSASPLLLAGKPQVPRLVWERVDPSSGAD